MHSVDVTRSPQAFTLEDPADRRKLGLIALSTDLSTERDYARIIPLDRASIHATRVEFTNPITPENLRLMEPRLTAAAEVILPGETLDAICYSCTSASVVIGDAPITKAIQTARPGVPVITPSGAALAAFRALGVTRISVLTPYLVDTSRHMAAYFETAGLQIQRFHCLDLEDDRDMARVSPQDILQAARATDTNETQAFFLSCTGMQAVDTITALEAQTGKPVVTSNQATAWALMHHAGLKPQSEAWGRLFGYEVE